MPVAIDGGAVVQFGARQRRKGQPQLFGAQFDSIFDIHGVWSMLVFFGMMVQATVHGSLEMKGVVGKLARMMAKCCWIEPERGTGGHCGED